MSTPPTEAALLAANQQIKNAYQEYKAPKSAAAAAAAAGTPVKKTEQQLKQALKQALENKKKLEPAGTLLNSSEKELLDWLNGLQSDDLDSLSTMPVLDSYPFEYNEAIKSANTAYQAELKEPSNPSNLKACRDQLLDALWEKNQAAPPLAETDKETVNEIVTEVTGEYQKNKDLDNRHALLDALSRKYNAALPLEEIEKKILNEIVTEVTGEYQKNKDLDNRHALLCILNFKNQAAPPLEAAEAQLLASTIAEEFAEAAKDFPQKDASDRLLAILNLKQYVYPKSSTEFTAKEQALLGKLQEIQPLNRSSSSAPFAASATELQKQEHKKNEAQALLAEVVQEQAAANKKAAAAPPIPAATPPTPAAATPTASTPQAPKPTSQKPNAIIGEIKTRLSKISGVSIATSDKVPGGGFYFESTPKGSKESNLSGNINNQGAGSVTAKATYWPKDSKDTTAAEKFAEHLAVGLDWHHVDLSVGDTPPAIPNNQKDNVIEQLRKYKPNMQITIGGALIPPAAKAASANPAAKAATPPTPPANPAAAPVTPVATKAATPPQDPTAVKAAFIAGVQSKIEAEFSKLITKPATPAQTDMEFDMSNHQTVYQQAVSNYLKDNPTIDAENIKLTQQDTQTMLTAVSGTLIDTRKEHLQVTGYDGRHATTAMNTINTTIINELKPTSSPAATPPPSHITPGGP